MSMKAAPSLAVRQNWALDIKNTGLVSSTAWALVGRVLLGSWWYSIYETTRSLSSRFSATLNLMVWALVLNCSLKRFIMLFVFGGSFGLSGSVPGFNLVTNLLWSQPVNETEDNYFSVFARQLL